MLSFYIMYSYNGEGGRGGEGEGRGDPYTHNTLEGHRSYATWLLRFLQHTNANSIATTSIDRKTTIPATVLPMTAALAPPPLLDESPGEPTTSG